VYLAEVGYDMVGMALGERGCLRAAPDADDEAKSAGARRGDAGDGILEHHCLRRRNAEAVRGFKNDVGSRLASQTELSQRALVRPLRKIKESLRPSMLGCSLGSRLQKAAMGEPSCGLVNIS
jgi:hypothetical protein